VFWASLRSAPTYKEFSPADLAREFHYRRVQMLGVFAEFERAMIQERVKAGLARAKKRGIRLGCAKISKKTENHIIKLRNSVEPPMGMLKVAKTFGVV